MFTPAQLDKLEGHVRGLKPDDFHRAPRTVDQSEHSHRTKYFFGYRYTVRWRPPLPPSFHSIARAAALAATHDARLCARRLQTRRHRRPLS